SRCSRCAPHAHARHGGARRGPLHCARTVLRRSRPCDRRVRDTSCHSDLRTSPRFRLAPRAPCVARPAGTADTTDLRSGRHSQSRYSRSDTVNEHASIVPCAVPGTPLAGAMPGIMICVHCGFCLQACPTYLALGDENDSPRGRIVLMRSVVEGTLSLDDPALQEHIDRCLGCRGCETACPSGVPYGQLLEATRATIAQRVPPPGTARVLLWIFAHAIVLRPALLAARVLRATGLPRALSRLRGRLGFAFAMLAVSAPPRLVRRSYRPHGSRARGTVALLRG